MGRNKIRIELLKDLKDRKTTYTKRVVGLKNKARELSTLCGTDVVLITFPPNANGEIHQYCNRNLNDVMKRLMEMNLQDRPEDGASPDDLNPENFQATNQANNPPVPDNPANSDTFHFQEPRHNNQLFGLPSLDDVLASGDFSTMSHIHHELKQYLQGLDHMIRTAGDFHLSRESMDEHNFGASSNPHNQFNAYTQFSQGPGQTRQHIVYNHQEENQHGIGVVPNSQQFHFNPTQHHSFQTQQAPRNFNPQGNFNPNFKP